MRNRIFEIYLRSLIGLLVILRVFYWTKKIDRRKIINRDWVLIQEVRSRGKTIENLVFKNRPTRFYRLKNGPKWYLFETMPLGNSYRRLAHEDIANKWFVKKIFIKENIPTPEGRAISSFDEAQRFGENFGYPVVIKPLDQSRCLGVTIGIQSKSDLKLAIRETKKFGRKFLIEKQVEGSSFRVMIVQGRAVGVCLRKPPYVIGNGHYSIKELVAAKNADQRRGSRAISTLHPIKIDYRLLKSQEMDGNFIPQKEQTIILNRKINLGSGAETVDLTRAIHPKIVKLCTRVAEILDAQVLGLDVITADISQAPSRKNQVWLIEVNSLPFIDMHHFPYEGEAQNVAAAIWDMVLN